MVDRYHGPSPGDRPDKAERLHQIHFFWEQLGVGGTPGETTWEELERLKAQVEAALAASPQDITKAESLTAYAALLMTGLTTL